MGDRESIGGHIAVGYLTSETVVADGAAYRASAGADLHADAEALVAFARDVDVANGSASIAAAVGGYGAALELVDLAPVAGGPAGVVTANIFHRAVTFREIDEPPSGAVRMLVDGDVRAAGPWPEDLSDRLAAAAGLLAVVGERFRAGDVVITGSIVQVPAGSAHELRADFGGATTVGLRVERVSSPAA